MFWSATLQDSASQNLFKFCVCICSHCYQSSSSPIQEKSCILKSLWWLDELKKETTLVYPYLSVWLKSSNATSLVLYEERNLRIRDSHVIKMMANDWKEFSVFTRSSQIKIKIVTIQWKKSRVWDTIDNWYINNPSKNQVSAVCHSRVICRSTSPKFIELCMETPCLCPSEGHKHGCRKAKETSVTEFYYWSAKLLL